jgi:hypothetical protein
MTGVTTRACRARSGEGRADAATRGRHLVTRRPDVHGRPDHAGEQPGRTRLEPVRDAGHLGGDQRRERHQLPRAAHAGAHELRRRQPDLGVHQGRSPGAQHVVPRSRPPAGRPLGLPPPVQHRRLRLRQPRAARLERPCGRGRPRPRRRPVRPRAAVRHRGREDPPHVRPGRGAVAEDQGLLPRARACREGPRHGDLHGHELPGDVLEGPRGRAARGVHRDRGGVRHPHRQRGGLPALPRHRGAGGRAAPTSPTRSPRSRR